MTANFLATDAAPDRTFPGGAVIVRDSANWGIGGAIKIGIAHALRLEFDWAWLFGADTF
jgi:hypothetical protein